MNAAIIHMIKASLYLASFYLVYRVFLSHDTLYSRNRKYLLTAAISSLILPFFTIRISEPLVSEFQAMLSEIFIFYRDDVQTASAKGSRFIGSQNWPVLVYLAGAAVFTLKFIADLAELIWLISRHKRNGSRIIRFRGLDTAGFSAFGHIFINERLSKAEAKDIVKHEKNHLAHYHSVDIIIIEIVKILQWFNPAIYMFSRSLKAIHEYQADEECISTGINPGKYQQLLLNQIFNSRVFTITNSFSNPSLIKKRMIMMTKKRSRALANLKLLMVLPVIAAMMIAISSCSQKSSSEQEAELVAPPPPPPSPAIDEDDPNTFEVVDQMPVFAGGDLALIQFIAENTKYPEAAAKNGIQGKVIVRFAVEADGSVERIKILKGVDPDLDREALRVVGELPDFEKPGVKDRKNVAVWYAVPINFALR